MRIDLISVVPSLLKSPFEASILKRALDNGLVDIAVHNLRDYANNNYKSVDDYQFGGGAGMVLTIEPSIEYLPGKILVHEENIVITDSGAKLLTNRAPYKIPEILS